MEAEILYGAVFGNEKTLHYEPELFRDIPDLFSKICPDKPKLKSMIQVREIEGVEYFLDTVSNHAICGRRCLECG